jgi:CRISPR system Cascade subunit CasB
MSDTHPLVRALEAIYERDDRGALAALRRGGVTPLAALPYVAPYFPAVPNPWLEDAYLLVAGLFALHPGRGGLSLGAALARVKSLSGSDSVELRFRALLGAEREDLATHLRHAVSLCASNAVPVDYDDLLRAVRGWNYDKEPMQRHWARDFWSHTTEQTEEAHSS